jgi:hypothetical protein
VINSYHLHRPACQSNSTVPLLRALYARSGTVQAGEREIMSISDDGIDDEDDAASMVAWIIEHSGTYLAKLK